MTREELKEHCKKQIESCEMWAKAKGEEPSGKIYEEHKMILELLEQTIWTPVSAGLPKKYGIYYVTLNNHDTDFCEFYPDEQSFGMNRNICDEVTAWMPLPKPYVGESENKG